MKAIALIAPLLIAAPLTLFATSAAAEPGDTSGAPSNPGAPELPDISGTWAQKIVTSAVSKVSMIGEVVSQTVSINQVQIDQDGRDLSVTTTPCDIDLRSDQSMIKTHIPRTYIDAIEPRTRKATLQGNAGHYALDVPGHTTVLGAALKDPNTRLPTQPDDPRVRDPDQDGHPGITMRISGFIKSDLYIVQKNWDKMKGRLLEGDKIAGPVTWKSSQVILEATSRMVGDSPASAPHPDAEQSYFRMVRVAPGAQCANIVQKKEQLF